jgi:CMP-N-acetylneuraminic acid synthetase
MKAIGIVPVKATSLRFEGKNLYKHNGKELFLHNVEVLLKAGLKVYAPTNEKLVFNILAPYTTAYAMHRPENISLNEQGIFDVVRWAYLSLNEQYDIIVIALANCINLKPCDVQAALKLMELGNFNEVRSYDKEGKENGLIVIKTSALFENKTSTYCGAIITEAKEIHYKNELI